MFSKFLASWQGESASRGHAQLPQEMKDVKTCQNRQNSLFFWSLLFSSWLDLRIIRRSTSSWEDLIRSIQIPQKIRRTIPSHVGEINSRSHEFFDVKIPHLFLVQPVESLSFPYFHQILHLKKWYINHHTSHFPEMIPIVFFFHAMWFHLFPLLGGALPLPELDVVQRLPGWEGQLLSKCRAESNGSNGSNVGFMGKSTRFWMSCPQKPIRLW